MDTDRGGKERQTADDRTNKKDVINFARISYQHICI